MPCSVYLPTQTDSTSSVECALTDVQRATVRAAFVGANTMCNYQNMTIGSVLLAIGMRSMTFFRAHTRLIARLAGADDAFITRSYRPYARV